MPTLFCPACSTILMGPNQGIGPRVHCQRCGEVVTLPGLGAECAGHGAPSLVAEAVLRDWQDRFPLAQEPFDWRDSPRLL